MKIKKQNDNENLQKHVHSWRTFQEIVLMKCWEFSTPKGMDADILSAELPNEEVVSAVDLVLNIQEIYHSWQ
jgi:hypothetical protein